MTANTDAKSILEDLDAPSPPKDTRRSLKEMKDQLHVVVQALNIAPDSKEVIAYRSALLWAMGQREVKE